jgi:hypothetical protein
MRRPQTQALEAMWGLTYSKVKQMVGAKGFEPSTSWSRTMSSNSINAFSRVAYGTRSIISALLVAPNLYLVAERRRGRYWIVQDGARVPST